MAVGRVFILGGAVLALASVMAGAARADDVQDVVDRVQRDTGGRILSAETVNMGRSRVYRVKVLTPDGRVRVVQVPAAGGDGRTRDAREETRGEKPNREPQR